MVGKYIELLLKAGFDVHIRYDDETQLYHTCVKGFKGGREQNTNGGPLEDAMEFALWCILSDAASSKEK